MGSGSVSDARIQWLWKEIEAARARGDEPGEREGLERLLADPPVRDTPDGDLALLCLATLDLGSGRAREAAEALTGFRWHGVPGAAGLLMAADAFLRLDWFERARETFEEYLKARPEDLDARRKLGLCLLLLDRDAEAERILLATSRREQNRVPSTLAYLAMLEAKRGNLAESLHLLMQARDLAPFDRAIEHSLIRIEALRVTTRRGALEERDLPLRTLVPGMAAGMMQLHGCGPERIEKARAVWEAFCAEREPAGRKPAIWAAALEYAVTSNGPHYTQEELAAEYGVSASRIKEHFRRISEAVDLDAFNRADILSRAAGDGEALLWQVRSSGLTEVLTGLAGGIRGFETPGEAAAWVLERFRPSGETERQEVEDFVLWMWRRSRDGG